jgi:glycosyltransferase involved in cell wall biosynthesis
MTISVIITTLNRPILFKRALQSCFYQTIVPNEIIVVEDGGDFSVVDWVKSLNRDNIIFIRHEKTKGLSASRNTGLKLSKSNLIAFLDDDDEWLPNRLNEPLKFYKTLTISNLTKLACIQVGCNILNEKNELISIALPVHCGNMKKSIIHYKGVVTHSSCFLFTKQSLLNVNGFDTTLKSGIDHDIWMKLAIENYDSYNIQLPLVNVYIDSRETMMKNTKQRLVGIEEYVNKWKIIFDDWFDKSFYRRYYILVISGLLGVKLANNEFKDSLHIFNNLLLKSKLNLRLNIFLFTRMTKVYVYHKFPNFRHFKRKFSATNHVQT